MVLVQHGLKDDRKSEDGRFYLLYQKAPNPPNPKKSPNKKTTKQELQVEMLMGDIWK